jgi:predicted TIM-barrel fold metal-dependent hydrolase
MFKMPDGTKLFVVDGHTHLWDARPENLRNHWGQTFIDTFFLSHNGLTPVEQRWPWERFRHYGVENAGKDLFVDGYVDKAIMMPTYLFEFYTNGFNTTEQCAALKEAFPDKVILAGRIDPRDGEAGLEQLEKDHARWGFRSVKMYTAEWKDDSHGYSLKDDRVPIYLDKCRALGIDIVHVHKGPTIHPLNSDAFDVRDIDEVATNFPDLKFVVDHCGIPRIDDFCWIANQEPNVYGGLSVVQGFVHMRPRYFASMMADLLFFVGADRLLFGSDYGIHSPKWLVEEIAAFQFDDETAREAGTQLTLDVKAKILGLNAARLYGIDVPAECYQPAPVEPVREAAE